MKYPYEILPEEYERIESYLSGELTKDQQKEFELLLESDPLWQQKTNEVKLLLTGINESVLRGKLNNFHQGRAQAPVRKLNFSAKRLLIAASTLLVVATAGWFLFFGKPRNEKLYSAYYTPDPGLPGNMGGGDNYQFGKAMLDYKNGEYKNAIDGWKNLPANDTVVYFLGMAMQASGNSNGAIEYLEKTVSRTDNPFFKDACWYIGLAFLKQDNSAKAIQYIEQSSNPEKNALLNELKDNK